MKNDIGYFYDINREVSMELFVEALWVLLARESQTIDFNRPNIKIAALPTNYKEIIETILKSYNNWPIEFSKLIDINLYFERQSEWEEEFSNALEKFVVSSNKKLKYDFQFDYIELEFTEEEIEQKLSMYDAEFLSTMNHFVNIIKSYGVNRKSDLRMKESERNLSRKFIQVSDTSFSNTWE